MGMALHSPSSTGASGWGLANMMSTEPHLKPAKEQSHLTASANISSPFPALTKSRTSAPVVLVQEAAVASLETPGAFPAPALHPPFPLSEQASDHPFSAAISTSMPFLILLTRHALHFF